VKRHLITWEVRDSGEWRRKMSITSDWELALDFKRRLHADKNVRAVAVNDPVKRDELARLLQSGLAASGRRSG
jgi:hypothetical protein